MDFEVIIVDDDAVVLFLHKVLIKRSRLPGPSGEFRDGREALDYIEKNNVQENPFLVLLDINMPVMNGWEFLDAVQSRGFKENVFVAMVTSSINSNDMKTASEYPQVIQYIEKPLQSDVFDDLYRKMQDLIKNN